jgi:hypothetical protein
MLTETAFDELHVSVVLPSNAMLFGLADMLTFGSWFTVTVTLAESVPPRPVTLIVYVVVTAGVTEVDELTSTLPMPLSILAVSALVDVHVRVVDVPSLMGFGAAEMLTVGFGYTVTVTLSVALPNALVAVIV